MGAFSWGMRMLAHLREMQEFRIALMSIQPIMTDSSVSREDKRKTLNMMVNELSERTFKLQPVAEQIMTIINIEKEVCEEYPSTVKQVEGILGWLPRFEHHRKLLFAEVKEHRREYGLKV